MSVKTLAKNSLIVSIMLGLSSILGLFRESVVAYKFGATNNTDAFFIAMIIPTLFINLVKVSVTSTFISVYTQYIVEKRVEEGREMINTILSFLLILMVALSGIFFSFTSELVHLMAPSYVGEQLLLAVRLTRILLPSMIFGTLTGVLVGINNAHDSFIAPAMVGFVSNVVMILSIFILGSLFGIDGLAIGSLLGIIAQFAIQIPSVVKRGLRFRFRLDVKNSGMRETMRLVAPFILSAVASQMNLIVDRTLATGLNQGMVSALYFANKLVALPLNIFSGAVGMVVFPMLSKAAAKGDWESIVDGIQRSFRLLTLFLLPAGVGIFILRFPLVMILFEHGAFTSADTYITADTLVYLIGTLYFSGIAIIFINLFFSLKKVMYTVMAVVITVIVNVSLSLVLIHPLQQKGLALANSLSAGVNLLLLMAGAWAVIRSKRKNLRIFNGLGHFLCQEVLAVVVMAVVLLVLLHPAQQYFTTQLGLGLTIAFLVLVGVFVYLLAGYLLRIKEINEIYNMLNKRFRRTSNI